VFVGADKKGDGERDSMRAGDIRPRGEARPGEAIAVDV
jgi:hypothetical protein